jgi:NitT/TauT family transport system substrate-binding protein
VERKPLATFALGILLATVIVSAFFMSQQGGSAQRLASSSNPSPTLEKFKAGGYVGIGEQAFLVMDAGKERGIWSTNGLDPEWIVKPATPFGPSELREQVESGARIGVGYTPDVLTIKSQGVPVKVVAGYIGLPRATKIYVSNDSPIRSIKDLDRKKIGVTSPTAATGQVAIYLSVRSGIEPEIIPLGNVSNLVVALKLGRVDAIVVGTIAIQRLVDSRELRILAEFSDFAPKPWVQIVVWATDDLIQQNPDLVKRFVKATLESVKYLNDNPSYAADLYIKRTNAPADLANKVPSQTDWTPNGRGSGQDLIAALKNMWQYNKDVGAIPANSSLKVEDAVDVRFLP